MLSISGIKCYAADSNSDALYTKRAISSRENVIESRNKLVSGIDTIFQVCRIGADLI